MELRPAIPCADFGEKECVTFIHEILNTIVRLPDAFGHGNGHAARMAYVCANGSFGEEEGMSADGATCSFWRMSPSGNFPPLSRN